ncbi:hypothetical protein VPH35_053991 [Triticum aestivum]
MECYHRPRALSLLSFQPLVVMYTLFINDLRNQASENWSNIPPIHLRCCKDCTHNCNGVLPSALASGADMSFSWMA